MLLTKPQVDVICASVVKNFGQSARVWLFGSRVDAYHPELTLWEDNFKRKRS